MRVALLSDVHANLPAFQAVLETARRRRVDEVVVLGNLVGAGGAPEEVVALALKRGVTVLAGPFELAVSRGARVPPALRAADAARADAFHEAAERAARALSTRQLAWMKALPPARRVRYAGRHVLLASGAPGDPWTALAPDAPDAHLADVVSAARADVLVTGGSGRAVVRALPGGRAFVDAGSVGRSADGPEAAFVLADFAEDAFRVESVPYDGPSSERDRLKGKDSYPVVPDTPTHNPAESEG